MNYRLAIESKSAYLHVIVTGVNSVENVRGYMTELIMECKSRSCWSVLIEERLEGKRLGTMDIFDTVSRGSSHVVGKFKAIAFVDINAEGGLMAFAEDVAVNRGIPFRVFKDVEEAGKWLIGKSRSGD